MEKRTPHCKLSRVKTLVETGNVRMTTSAVFGARQLGFTEAEAIGIVMSLDTADFYKSMTTYADHTIWQDVYLRRTVNGDVYLKLTVIDDVLIVSFKER
ncbi:type II toxin-antitoxin system MqsR family toxin [Burkholderia sp. SIMBA_062]|uniref:type II toxin-antitoxin system MqsR family toxin n=1 Tax=Burkholderia sp. SIMBA_062 TaxID=3085803 RepID=UPI0039796774